MTNDVVYNEMLAEIRRIETSGSLYEEINFPHRMEEIDFLEFHIIDRINAFLEVTGTPEPMITLMAHAKRVKSNLEAVTTGMFNRLRLKIAQGDEPGKVLMDFINIHHAHNGPPQPEKDTVGYDNLDLFLNGLLSSEDMPVETKDRDPEMVFYQKTPARIVLALIERAGFKPDDVFFDLGSGLGQVTLLVNLLTSVLSKGVEFEPAFCRYAEDCAIRLHLNHVIFLNQDARYADYSSGTVFFMYTPFKGKMLLDVLHNLKQEAKKRKLRLFTYGPCTPEVAQQDWLIRAGPEENDPDGLGAFHSTSC